MIHQKGQETLFFTWKNWVYSSCVLLMRRASSTVKVKIRQMAIECIEMKHVELFQKGTEQGSSILGKIRRIPFIPVNASGLVTLSRSFKSVVICGRLHPSLFFSRQSFHSLQGLAL
jgi:hypothetical protein